MSKTKQKGGRREGETLNEFIKRVGERSVEAVTALSLAFAQSMSTYTITLAHKFSKNQEAK